MKYRLWAWFTLVELIVVITILAILGTIWFISFSWFQTQSRDSVRISDLATLSRAIELTKLETWVFPSVSSGSLVTFSGSTVWTQWEFWIDSLKQSRRISEAPTDPLTGNFYAYSITQSTWEYQIWAILEWWSSLSFKAGMSNTLLALTPQAYAATLEPQEFSGAYILGNYNGMYIVHSEILSENNKRLYVLGVPSILSSDIGDVDVEDIFTNNTFIFKGKKTIPWPYKDLLKTENTGWSFTPNQTQYGIDNNSKAVTFVTTSQELSSWSEKVNFIGKP